MDVSCLLLGEGCRGKSQNSGGDAMPTVGAWGIGGRSEHFTTEDPQWPGEYLKCARLTNVSKFAFDFRERPVEDVIDFRQKGTVPQLRRTGDVGGHGIIL